MDIKINQKLVRIKNAHESIFDLSFNSFFVFLLSKSYFLSSVTSFN